MTPHSILGELIRNARTSIRSLAERVHISMLGADFDVLVLVRAPDNAALRDLVLDRIQSIPGVRSTRTWLVFDELLGPGAEWS